MWTRFSDSRSLIRLPLRLPRCIVGHDHVARLPLATWSWWTSIDPVGVVYVECDEFPGSSASAMPKTMRVQLTRNTQTSLAKLRPLIWQLPVQTGRALPFRFAPESVGRGQLGSSSSRYHKGSGVALPYRQAIGKKRKSLSPIVKQSGVALPYRQERKVDKLSIPVLPQMNKDTPFDLFLKPQARHPF